MRLHPRVAAYYERAQARPSWIAANLDTGKSVVKILTTLHIAAFAVPTIFNCIVLGVIYATGNLTTLNAGLAVAITTTAVVCTALCFLSH
jgi:hypothetical protein